MGIFLSPGHVLHGMYAIGNDVPPYVEGRFLIYHGKDLMNGAQRIIIKEYFPYENTSSFLRDVNGRIGPDPQFIRRKNELRIWLRRRRNVMERLRHIDGVISPMDSFEENDTIYLIQKDYPCITLRQIMDRAGGRLGYDVICRTLYRAFLIVKRIANDKIYDPGLSPHTILVNGDEVAILSSDIEGLTDSGLNEKMISVKGKYTPPELYDKGDVLLSRTMVYNCAMIMYDVLTAGLMPDFTDRRKVRLPRPSELGIVLPHGVEDALMRGLELDPWNRQHSMRDLIEGILPIDVIDPVSFPFSIIISSDGMDESSKLILSRCIEEYASTHGESYWKDALNAGGHRIEVVLSDDSGVRRGFEYLGKLFPQLKASAFAEVHGGFFYFLDVFGIMNHGGIIDLSLRDGQVIDNSIDYT